MAGPVRIVVLALAAVAGAFGLRAGWVAVKTTESGVIERYAALYVSDIGGHPTDCAASPGQGRVWLTVRCSGAAGTRIYQINRAGRLLSTRPDEPAA